MALQELPLPVVHLAQGSSREEKRSVALAFLLVFTSAGTAPLEQDGFVVELLPKLAFFMLWDRPPSSGLVRSPEREDSAGGLPSGGPPLAGPEESPEPMGGGADPAVLSPADDAPVRRPLLMTPDLPLT